MLLCNGAVAAPEVIGPPSRNGEKWAQKETGNRKAVPATLSVLHFYCPALLYCVYLRLKTRRESRAMYRGTSVWRGAHFVGSSGHGLATGNWKGTAISIKANSRIESKSQQSIDRLLCVRLVLLNHRESGPLLCVSYIVRHTHKGPAPLDWLLLLLSSVCERAFL